MAVLILVPFVALALWTGFAIVTALVRRERSLALLRRDPAAWLGDRGVVPVGSVAFTAVQGSLAGPRGRHSPWVVLVVDSSHLVLESCLPAPWHAKRMVLDRVDGPLRQHGDWIESADRSVRFRTYRAATAVDLVGRAGWSEDAISE